MLDLSPDKLLMLGIVALVVLGPNRLPGAARTVGRFVGQMRAMSTSLQSEVRQALHDPADPAVSSLAEFRPSEVRRSVRRALTETLSPLDPSSGADPATRPTTGLPPGPGPSGWSGGAVPDDPGFN